MKKSRSQFVKDYVARTSALRREEELSAHGKQIAHIVRIKRNKKKYTRKIKHKSNGDF